MKYAINNVGSSYFKINLFFIFFLILNGSLSMKPLFLMVSWLQQKHIMEKSNKIKSKRTTVWSVSLI